MKKVCLKNNIQKLNINLSHNQHQLLGGSQKFKDSKASKYNLRDLNMKENQKTFGQKILNEDQYQSQLTNQKKFQNQVHKICDKKMSFGNQNNDSASQNTPKNNQILHYQQEDQDQNQLTIQKKFKNEANKILDKKNEIQDKSHDQFYCLKNQSIQKTNQIQDKKDDKGLNEQIIRRKFENQINKITDKNNLSLGKSHVIIGGFNNYTSNQNIHKYDQITHNLKEDTGQNKIILRRKFKNQLSKIIDQQINFSNQIIDSGIQKNYRIQLNSKEDQYQNQLTIQRRFKSQTNKIINNKNPSQDKSKDIFGDQNNNSKEQSIQKSNKVLQNSKEDQDQNQLIQRRFKNNILKIEQITHNSKGEIKKIIDEKIPNQDKSYVILNGCQSGNQRGQNIQKDEEARQPNFIFGNNLKNQDISNGLDDSDFHLIQLIDQVCAMYFEEKNIICQNVNKQFELVDQEQKQEDSSEFQQVQNQLNKNDQKVRIDQIEQTGSIQLGQQQNVKQNLETEDLKFIKSIFKIDKYLNSGGEADIYMNKDKDIAFRIIKQENDRHMDVQLEELKIIKQFQEDEHILDLNISHFAKNKENQQSYIIHTMQRCQKSMFNELNLVREYSLNQVLDIIFTSLHFLILLRQKYIYHSDIKPGNMLKINNQYKFSDFGASKTIPIKYPFLESKMWTDCYKPQNDFNQNLPFYHDIYAVCKTFQQVLVKLKTHSNIKEELNKLIQTLLKDDEDSCQLDCFELPQKFMDCLIDQEDKEINQFLEKYLDKIEKYLTIKKENKPFKYESQYQYAQIALNILNKNLNIQKNNKNSLKMQVFQTLAYIFFKRQKYDESIYYIQQIFNENLFQNNPQNHLISLLTQLMRILFKQNRVSKSSKILSNLMEFIKNCQLSEQLFELKFLICKFQLENESESFQTQAEFLEQLENIDQKQMLNIVYRLTIKYFKYLQSEGICNSSICKFIRFLNQDEIDSSCYYQQKLLKKIGLYLYQIIFRQDKQLDIAFYVDYENEIQLLPQIIYKYFQFRQDQPIEVCFDSDTWELYFILLDLKQRNIYDFGEYEDKVKNLIEKYQKMIPIQKQEELESQFEEANKELPFEEQKDYKRLLSKYRYNEIEKEVYDKINCLTILDSLGELATNTIQIQKDQTSLVVNLNSSDLNMVNQSPLVFIASNLKKINTLQFYFRDQFNFRNGAIYAEKLIDSFQGITNKTLGFIIENIGDDGALNIESVQVKFQNLTKLHFHLSGFENNISDEGAQWISKALDQHKSLIELNLNLSGLYNKIKDQIAQVIIGDFKQCQYFTQLNIKLRDGDCESYAIQTKVGKMIHQNIDKFNVSIKNYSKYLEQEQQKQNSSEIETVEKESQMQNQQNIQIDLYLNYNIIREDILQYLQKYLKHDIILTINQFNHSQKEVQSIESALKLCKNVTQLNLNLREDNEENQGIQAFANILEKYVNLRKLNLSFNSNKNTDEGVQSIASVLKKFCNITWLEIQLNSENISDYGVQIFATALENSKSINFFKICLDSKNISDQGVVSILNAIEKFEYITGLELNFNSKNISDSIVKNIAFILSGFKLISNLNLNLSNNNCSDEGAISLAETFEQNLNIIQLNLNLSSNRICDKGALKIANALSKFNKITQLELDLQQNKVEEQLIQTIENDLQKVLIKGRASYYEDLSIDDNQDSVILVL
ncbi:hypothetical protein ABPG74_018902 [Tetrahymena malaccensis]